MNESSRSAVGYREGDWDEAELVEFAIALRRRLGSNAVTFGLVFVAPNLSGRARELLELLRVHAQIPVLVGCSSMGLVEGGREIESASGVVLGLFALPGAIVQPVAFPATGDSGAIARRSVKDPAGIHGWLAFVEPFHTDAENWIESLQSAFPGVPIYGGLATGQPGEAAAQIYCDGEVIEAGGVALAVSGVRVLGAVAQGCTPVGETWTITRSEGNIIHRIGNRPAVAVLEETFGDLDEEVRRRSRGSFFAGLAVDEYLEDHRRGDFLVRNLIGADPDSGALAIAATPRQGQTMQFQMRDAAAADEDIRRMLGRLRDDVGRSRVLGGCVSLCVGRGQGLFGERDHDAALVRQIIGPVGIAGFFCNGEFGPVGRRSFVHGYTASLVLFVEEDVRAEDDL
ncbi:MAG TPA: FIST N-terminal domain-containing protein [Opitutaceae bacterium]